MRTHVIILLCLAILAGYSVTAQVDVLSFDDLPRKERKKYQESREALNRKDNKNAIRLLNEVADKYPSCYAIQKELAVLYLKTEDYDLAARQLEILDDFHPVPEVAVRMSMADAYEAIDSLSKAIASIAGLLERGDIPDDQRPAIERRLEELEFRKNAYDHPLDIEFERLSSEINTEGLEYLPAFNAQGDVMIFTRRPTLFSNEDLFYVRKDSAGKFSKAWPLEELNTPRDEGAFCYSPDGNILIFASSDRPDSYGGFDLYISFSQKGRWTPPVNMGPFINTRYWESQPSIAHDNRTIYFSSTRPGGMGNKDIWKIELKKGNTWTEPENLGPAINTEGDESSPFIHPDDQTLYFRSTGHIGLGGYDIFRSHRDETGTWSEVTNIGYPINTKGSEGALFVDLKGQYAYYSSDAESLNKHLDIYRFELPEKLKPQPASFVKLKVLDAQTREPLRARIVIQPFGDSLEVTERQTDTEGTLLSVIKTGSYGISVEHPGYIFYSEYIDVENVNTLDKPFYFEILLQKLPQKDTMPFESAPVVLNNIFFESGSDALLPVSFSEIARLYAFMQENPFISVKIVGHTDNIGEEEDNLVLSENRARAVYNALVERGIDESRLSYQGMGEQQPIADNVTAEGRRKNRRTEFIVIDK